MSILHNHLLTPHKTFLQYNAETNAIAHSFCKGNLIEYQLTNENINLQNFNILRFFEKYSEAIGNASCGLEIVQNQNNTISLKFGSKFLSARPDGTVCFQPWNRIWEQFYLGSDIANDAYFKLISGVFNYLEKRGKAPKILSCCWGGMPPREEWLCTDINEGQNIFCLDISKPFPIPGETFDYIIIEHGIEHVDFDGVINFLCESYRILKVNGVLRICTPGLDKWIQYYIINDDVHERITDIAYRRYFPHGKAPFIRSKALALII